MEGECPWVSCRWWDRLQEHSLLLIREAEHSFQPVLSQDHLPALFHSEASSNPVKRKITGSNPNIKQSLDMVISLSPASEEIATFTLYVSDPPEHTAAQLHTRTHTHLYILHLQIISDVEPLKLL